jgi:hypothetical protein
VYSAGPLGSSGAAPTAEAGVSRAASGTVAASPKAPDAERPPAEVPAPRDAPGAGKPGVAKPDQPGAGTPDATADTEPTIAAAEPTTAAAEPTTAAAEPTTAAAPTGPATPPATTDGAPAGDEVWSRYSPEPERVLSRPRRIGAATGRVLIHEWTIAALAALLLAVAMSWPTLRHPTETIPQDVWDPTLQAWQVAWAGHVLLTDPAQLWHGNAFWPDRYSYAFSDSLLGYAPFGMIGEGPVAAVVRYNILFVLAYALALFGAYALVRQLGSGRTGAAVAAVAYAFAPWRLAQAGHLHVMSSGGIALSLAMLARGHGWSLRHGYRPERRHTGWILAGWLVAAWQLTLGFGIGLPFMYVLLLICVATPIVWFIRRPFAGKRPFGFKLIFANIGGGLLFATVGLLMALPYLKVVELHPNAERSPQEVAQFSSPLRGFFTAPAESWLWGERHAEARALLPWHPEMTLLPGFMLVGLAAAGLIFSIWRVRTRILLAAGVALTVILCMGTEFADGGRPGYMTLYDLLPGWNGIRTPGRLVLWTTLLLGILAAGAVSAFVERAGELSADRVQRVSLEPGPLIRLATLIPLALVLIEGVNQTPHPRVPPPPAVLRQVEGPVLVLPSDQAIDQNVMLWSTDGFPKVVNGSSGFIPASLQRTRESTATFPDATSVAYLRELGVRTVVLLPVRAPGTPWQQAAQLPVDGLDIQREERDGVIIFRLS